MALSLFCGVHNMDDITRAGNKHTGISRRLALKYVGSIAVGSALFDRRVFAQAAPDFVPDWLAPYFPYITAAGAIASVISAIISADQNQQILNKLSEIDSKLDTVIQGEQVILDAVRDHPNAMEQAVLDGWEASYGRQLDAMSTQFNATLAMQQSSPKSAAPYWQAIAMNAPTLTIELGDCDYGVFPFFGQGLAISMVAMQVLKIPLAAQRTYYNKFAECLAHWIAKDNERGIPAAIASLTSTADTREAQLKSLPTQILVASNRLDFIGTDGQGQSARCYRYDNTYLNVSGTFETGYTGTQSVTSTPQTCTSELHPPGSPGSPLVQALPKYSATLRARIVDSMTQVAAQAPAVAVIPRVQPTIPAYVPSGFPIVDQRNQTRISAYSMRAKAVDLPWVTAQMQHLVAALQAI
jgi:hypothetical protein